MLIQPKFKVNDYVTLKMIGGDEIIGKLVDITDNRSYVINNPQVVMMAQQGFGLMPYILTIEPKSDVEIDMCNVIAIAKTQDAVMKAYIKQTTNLVV